MSSCRTSSRFKARTRRPNGGYAPTLREARAQSERRRGDGGSAGDSLQLAESSPTVFAQALTDYPRDASSQCVPVVGASHGPSSLTTVRREGRGESASESAVDHSSND